MNDFLTLFQVRGNKQSDKMPTTLSGMDCLIKLFLIISRSQLIDNRMHFSANCAFFVVHMHAHAHRWSRRTVSPVKMQCIIITVDHSKTNSWGPSRPSSELKGKLYLNSGQDSDEVKRWTYGDGGKGCFLVQQVKNKSQLCFSQVPSIF